MSLRSWIPLVSIFLIGYHISIWLIADTVADTNQIVHICLHHAFWMMSWRTCSDLSMIKYFFVWLVANGLRTTVSHHQFINLLIQTILMSRSGLLVLNLDLICWHELLRPGLQVVLLWTWDQSYGSKTGVGFELWCTDSSCASWWYLNPWFYYCGYLCSCFSVPGLCNLSHGFWSSTKIPVQMEYAAWLKLRRGGEWH